MPKSNPAFSRSMKTTLHETQDMAWGGNVHQRPNHGDGAAAMSMSPSRSRLCATRKHDLVNALAALDCRLVPHESIDPLTRPQVGDWVVPWEVTDLGACKFYHAIDLPGIGKVGGDWDLRETIDTYLGHGSLEGLTFLDLGTASGFVSFAAERRGAGVISYDIGDPRKELHLVPLVRNDHRRDELLDHQERGVEGMKRSYWLAHRLLGSEAKAYYGNLYRLSELIYPVDVVHVGQILVHLRDPLGALTEAGRLARKRLVMVEGSLPTEEPIARLLANAKMEPPRSWWHFSIGFYRNFLEILGFEIEDVEVERHLCPAMDRWVELRTITAVRVEG
jgi:hypothetical protein